jgi:Mitochondrial ribosomal death-associated protein 3
MFGRPRSSLIIYLGIELVNCSAPYNYDPRTQTFLQPTLSATLLRQLKEANHSALETLTLASPFSLEKAPSGAPEVGSPLVQLIDYGVRETSVTSFVLDAVLAELASQTRYACVCILPCVTDAAQGIHSYWQSMISKRFIASPYIVRPNFSQSKATTSLFLVFSWNTQAGGGKL